MPAVVCPSCEESERLSGRRRPDHTVEIHCLACDTVWERDAARRCKVCGSTELEYAPRPLWAKGRGDQHTPAGRIDAYSCRACGGHDVTSVRPPLPAQADAGAHADVTAEAVAEPAATTALADDGAPVFGRPPPRTAEAPAHRLLALQRVDIEIDRLRARAEKLPEQRHADASADALREAAKTLTTFAEESRTLQAAGAAAEDGALAYVQGRLAAARQRGEELAAEHRRRLAAVDDAATAVAAALEEARARREAQASTLEPALREAYEAARRRVRDLVVPVLDIGACGGCRIVIPPSELEHARDLASTGLPRCPGCNRYLVFGVA